MNIERYIFTPNLKDAYIKQFNDYMITALYPEIKKASDYVNKEEE